MARSRAERHLRAARTGLGAAAIGLGHGVLGACADRVGAHRMAGRGLDLQNILRCAGPARWGRSAWLCLCNDTMGANFRARGW
ncbi:Uncharacterised protein [Bordetella pertussis]|nr:Uncharacterised protein [Bordetella pertussis]